MMAFKMPRLLPKWRNIVTSLTPASSAIDFVVAAAYPFSLTSSMAASKIRSVVDLVDNSTLSLLNVSVYLHPIMPK